MGELLGWTQVILGGALYLAQIVSSINFSLAQRLGIQEDPNHSDASVQRSERYTAYWDLLTLIWMPLGGALMLAGISYWPYFSLIGAAIYFDASGREAAKNLSFRHAGLRTGSPAEQRVFFASYIVMGCLALVVAIYAVSNLG